MLLSASLRFEGMRYIREDNSRAGAGVIRAQRGTSGRMCGVYYRSFLAQASQAKLEVMGRIGVTAVDSKGFREMMCCILTPISTNQGNPQVVVTGCIIRLEIQRS